MFGHALLYIRNPTDLNGWRHVKAGTVVDSKGKTSFTEGNQNLKKNY